MVEGHVFGVQSTNGEGFLELDAVCATAEEAWAMVDAILNDPDYDPYDGTDIGVWRIPFGTFRGDWQNPNWVRLFS